MTDTPTMTRAEVETHLRGPMPSFLTRAAAICACINIIDAVETLDDILRPDFARSVHDTAQSMRDRCKANPQYANITEKMDRWIRNTWTGIQKMNSKGTANEELFYGLSDVIGGLSAVPTAVENESGSGSIESDLPPVEGMEEADDTLAALAARLPKAPAKPRPMAQRESEAKVIGEAMASGFSEQKKALESELPPTRAWVQERISRARKNVIAYALSRFHETNVRIIDVNKVKHGDLSPIMKMSTSDRTQQLLDAAWISGYIAGAKGTAEEIEELLKKEK